MPIARLAVFLIKIQDRTKVLKTRETYNCPQCGLHEAVREKRWMQVVVFGVPVFTYKRRFEYRCPVCRTLYKTKKATFIQSALWMFY